MEVAALPKRYALSHPSLVRCNALARDAADVRIRCAIHAVALQRWKERSKAAEWEPPLLPQPEERSVLQAFRTPVLADMNWNGRQLRHTPNLDTRAMRGEVAKLPPFWDPMTRALSAGTAFEKKHADLSLRRLGKALGVEGY